MKKTAKQIIQENIQTIEEWALQGMTKKEIAKCLGVGYSTFRDEINQIPGTLALFKKIAITKKDCNKEKVENVEESLYKKAIGYNYIEEVPVKVKNEYFDEDGNKYTKEEVEVVQVKKHSPADVQAAKFFLTNRAKRIWQDNPHKVENDKESLKLKKKEVESRVF